VRGKTAVQLMEELHVQPETGRSHETDHHAVWPQGVHQRAWTDGVLEPPGHLLLGVPAVPAYILLGVPARGPEAQAGTPVSRGGVFQGVCSQTDSVPATGSIGAGPERV